MTTTKEDTSRVTSPDPLSEGDHVVNLNGVDIHYRVDGNGPLLFLVSPGWGIGSGYMQQGFKFLQKRFRLVFVDTRGSGLSGRPTDSAQMSSDNMADDLEALREHLRLATIQLLGHSNSGAIALSYATRYPKNVAKLVLIDSQLLGFSAGGDTQTFLEARADDRRFKAAVRAAISYFSGNTKPFANDGDLSAFVAEVLPLYLYRPERKLALAQEHLLVGQISLYAFEAQNSADRTSGSNQTTLLGRVVAPVLITVGRHDWICPVSVSERIHAGIPHSRLVTFEESGHMPWLEEPEKFSLELIQFLES